jgi:hypothetical protein
LPFETRASIFGRVVDVNNAPLAGYTIEAFDIPAVGAPRTDLTITSASDGSFRARLTDIPESVPEGTPPAHVLLRFRTATSITAMRDIYVHPGEVLDVGAVMLMQRDPKITQIGPAGGVATDSSGEFELTVPAGALSTTIPVQITPFKKREQFSLPLPDSTVTMYGFDLSPDGTKFAVPATLRIQNTKNIPITTEIPVGGGNIETGEWEHEGFARWDGTRFAGPVNHFSPGDWNLARAALWVLSFSRGNDPNDSKDGKCAGSTVGLTNGVLKATVELPETARRLQSRVPGLTYSSDLAGTFKPQAPPEVSPVPVPAKSKYDAYPSAQIQIVVRQSKTEVKCVPPADQGALGGGGSNAPGACVIGRCQTGSVLTFAQSALFDATGGGNANTRALLANASDAYSDGVFSVPTGAGATSSPGFQSQLLAVRLGG